jgi:transcriptional regulator with XRE-family HTH domain
MNPQEAFVTRLRRYRQRSRISLDEIAADTRVKRELLEALENNDLSEWPRGLYARAWIRGYASAVGLDPIDTVDEFCRLFPHGDRRTGGTIQEIATIVASPSGYRDEFSHPEDRRRPAETSAPEAPAPPKPGWHAPLVQAARAMWARVAPVGPYARARRSNSFMN